jgi:hypothetical protein
MAPQPGAFQADPHGAFPPAPPPDTFPGAAQPGFVTGQQPGKTEGKTEGKTRLLIGGAAAVAVLAVGAVIVTPRLLGPSDPGCKAYTGTALTAYNKTIRDLNAQAPQAKLSGDMTTAIAQLKTAAAKAQSASVKSALGGLRAELMTVQADVQKGSVPPATVSALNAAARTADKAC